MNSYRSNESGFLLQGCYDSQTSDYLKINDNLLKVDNLRKLRKIDGWQVALKKKVFNYARVDETKGLQMLEIPDEYEVDDWMIEINIGAWKKYKHDEGKC